MNIRELQPHDLSRINEIWEKHHKGIRGIPERKFIIADAVTYNGVISGYGMLRNFAEALMFLDKDASHFSQAKSFKLMMDFAISEAKKIGLDAINVGTNDPHFEDILKGMGFVDRGKTLILGLEDGKPTT